MTAPDAAPDRGAHVRILTTDYLAITDPDALTQLADLASGSDRRLEVRLFSGGSIAFHPKACIFWSSAGETATGYVGSSNLSASGIDGGVEWNLGTDRVEQLMEAFDGCYEARRAAALSGVPLSTVYHWARNGIIEPSVSPTRVKLWSYANLMGLRVVYWLRHPKQSRNREIAASPMLQVRKALDEMESRGLDIWDDSTDEPDSPLRVDQAGKIWVQANGIVETDGQQALPETLDLLGPFELGQLRGPDLLRPRPHLRIIPGKMSGDPHLAGSRITTQVAAALYEHIPDADRIAGLYAGVDARMFEEAIEFEHSLAA